MFEVIKKFVTPKMALAILEESEKVFDNRKIKKQRVKSIAGDMLRGTFYWNSGELISFCPLKGKQALINGQHRVLAIVYAASRQSSFKGSYLMMATGVPLEAFRYIDQGSPRTIADILFINGNGAPSLLASAGLDLWKWNRVGDPTKKVTGFLDEAAGNIATWIENNVSDLLEVKAQLGVRSNSNCTQGILLAMGYKWNQEDPKLAEEFVRYIINPELENAPNRNIAFAVKAVRKVKDAARRDGGKRGAGSGDHFNIRLQEYLMYLTAWNSAVAGKFYRGEAGFTKACQNREWFPVASEKALAKVA